MKKFIILAIVAIATTTSVEAQRNGSSKARKSGSMAVHKIGTKLNLSDNQKTQIKTINTNATAKGRNHCADFGILQDFFKTGFFNV